MSFDWKKYYKTNPEFIQKPYKDVTPIDIDDFLNNIVNTTEIKDKAFCNMCGILKQTFGYAVSARYISANENPYRVEVNRKKIIPTRKKASTQEVYNNSEKQFIKNSDIKNGEIHIRRQVVEDFDISNLDSLKRIGYHAVEYTKSDAGDRYIPLTQKAQEYIKQIQRINKETGESYQDFLFVKDGYILNPNRLYTLLKDACKRCIKIPVKGTHRIRKTFVSTLVNNGVPITTASRIAGHADERTTIKNYLFDTNNEEETKKAILNALEDNPESSVTTRYSSDENENVTKRDTNVILFPSKKKMENPCFKRISH